jgi:hypothetical protein
VPQVHRTMWAVLGLAGRWRIVMHQSGLHQRVSNMVRHYREQSDGLEVAPAILLGLYCAVAGCFAFGLYALHQPTRLSNPSLSVYQFPPATIVTYALSPRLSDAPQPIPLVEAAAPQPETTGTTAQWRNDVQKPHRPREPARCRRPRATDLVWSR